MSDKLSKSIGELRGFLAALFALAATGFIELRPMRRNGRALQQEFIPVDDLDRVVNRVVALREGANVYFGVAPRSREAGTKDAIEAVPAVWVDIDRPDAQETLDAFELPPSAIVSSGSGGRHAYWFLDELVSVEEAERLNRALVAALDGDPHAVDAGRILRPPATLNHKTEPAREVELGELSERRYAVQELEAALELGPDDQAPVSSQAGGDGVPEHVRRILDRLDAVRPSGSGWQALCPAHDDNNPSLSIGVGDGDGCLVYCHAGCSTDGVLASIGLGLNDLYGSNGGGSTQHSRLMRLVEQAEAVLFHDPQDEPYVELAVGGHHEVLRLGSKAFAQWLRKHYYHRHSGAVNREALTGAVDLLVAQAVHEGVEREVHRRVGGDLGEMFVDLGDPGRHVVRVTSEGWEVLERSPIAFVRDGSALALPVPERGGSLAELRPLVNLPDEEGWTRLLGSLIAAWHPFGPYFMTAIIADAGSAKSTLARLFSRLVDPRHAPFSVGAPTVSDIMASAGSSLLVGFDNVSRIRRELSDALCQLCTGAGYRRRMLYTDGDLFVLETKQPSIITARAQVVTQGDLIERTNFIEPPTIEPRDRRREAVLLEQFERLHRRILAGQLDAIAAALRHHDAVHIAEPPRMADAVHFVTAAEEGLGLPEGGFLNALQQAQEGVLTASAQDRPFIEAVLDLMRDHRYWAGSASELLKDTAAAQPDSITRGRSWPANAQVASTELDEYAAALGRNGISLRKDRAAGGNRERRIMLERAENRDAGRGGTHGHG